MAKTKKEAVIVYKKPKSIVYMYLGEKYYRRLFPTPYAYKPIDINKVKKDFFI
jgi:hypothetical protein